MRIARSSQESHHDDAPQVNNAREAFSIDMELILDCNQLGGFDFDAYKALLMFHENHYSHLHDLMNKIQTEAPSAPDNPPNKSEQNMIDALEEMKITPKKKQRVQCTFHSLH